MSEKDVSRSEPSSLSDVDIEKEAGPHLTEQEEDLIEASQPPFTEEALEPATDGGALEKVVSSKPSVNNIKSVPNGGLWAWLQVLGSFFLFFNSW